MTGFVERPGGNKCLGSLQAPSVKVPSGKDASRGVRGATIETLRSQGVAVLVQHAPGHRARRKCVLYGFVRKLVGERVGVLHHKCLGRSLRSLRVLPIIQA